MRIGAIDLALSAEQQLLITELTRALNRVANAMDKSGADGVQAGIRMTGGAPAPIPPAEPTPALEPEDWPAPPVKDGLRRAYSEAQIRTLLQMSADGYTMKAIAEKLRGMDGSHPTEGSLWQKVRIMKSAGEWSLPTKTRDAAFTQPVRAAAPPRTVTKGWALQWANQRGLCTDGVLDMDAVNDKARALGLSGFVLDTLIPRRVA